MMFKRFMAVCLMAAMMLGCLVACGQKEQNSESDGGVSTGKATETAAVQEEDSTDETEEPEDGQYHVDWEDMAEIHVVGLVTGAVPSGVQAVEDAINEITEKEINTHVSLTLLDAGSYAQQMNLMMSSNEAVDLMVTMPSGPSSFTTMASQSQLMDLTDLLKVYAPDILSEQAEVLKATTVDNKILGVPANKSFVTAININMRTDVLEDLGLLDKAQKMTSFAEYEEILEAVKNSDKWNGLAGIAANGTYSEIINVANSLMTENDFADCSYYDNLGDNMNIAGIYIEDASTEVFSFYSSDDYQAMCALAKEWYAKGYVYKDSATTKEVASELIKTNVAFSFMAQTEIGSEMNISAGCGMPMTTVPVVHMPITTSSVIKFVWAVPTTAKEPEAAVTFYNMAYSDPRIANLLAWGIEGTDYVVNDQGLAGYPNGDSAVAYHTSDICWPNRFIIMPWENESPDVRTLQREVRENAEYSPYIGFTCNTSAISTELSAVSNVIEEYKPQLNAGVAADGIYDEFINKLNASGVDVIITEYQKQLDEWLAR